MNSNLQPLIEKMRAEYGESRPLLARMVWAHELSVRDFAAIFGIAKSTAQEVMSQKSFPSLELGIRIARYFEVTVEELFGWRVDDGGERRPLVVIDPKTQKIRRLAGNGRTGAIKLAQEGRNGGDQEHECTGDSDARGDR